MMKDSMSDQQKLNQLYCRWLGLGTEYQTIPDSLDDIAELRRYEDPWLADLDSLDDNVEFPTSLSSFKTWYEEQGAQSLTHTQFLFNHLADKASLTDLSFYTHLYLYSSLW